MIRPTISLCMIVKDEERCIERCLESVHALVDEIIIVDTGSTDHTLEVISKYNLKVYHYEWDHHFANARNYAIEQATGDYILHLDADEWIEDPKSNLKTILNKEIYYLPIRNDIGGGLAEIHKFPRLFRNIKELRYVGALHEQINLSLNQHRSSGLLQEVLIHHDGYLAHIAHSKNKQKRNLDILLRENEENPSAFNLYNLGQQYYTDKKYQKSVEAYQQAFQYGGEYAFTKRLLLGLIQSLMKLRQYSEALSIARDSFTIYPDYIEFKYYEGLIYQEMGYLPDAEQCFEKCVEHGDSDPTVHYNTYEGTGSYLALAKLSEISAQQFDRKKANEYISRAIKKAPNVMGLLQRFLDINYEADRRALFDHITALWPTEASVIQQLVAVIYQLRHPVLVEFIERYNVQVDPGVSVFINLLKGEYLLASDYYAKSEPSNREQARELLLISFLLSDINLFDRFVHSVSLRSAEQKILKAAITKQAFTCIEFTSDFENTIYELVVDLLKIQDYQYIDYLSRHFITPQMRYVLSKAFYRAGFYEISLSNLIEGNTKEERYKIDLLAAQSLRQLHSFEDSLHYYKQALMEKEEPELAFQVVTVARQINDVLAAEEALQYISKLEPGSNWTTRDGQELQI